MAISCHTRVMKEWLDEILHSFPGGYRILRLLPTSSTIAINADTALLKCARIVPRLRPGEYRSMSHYAAIRAEAQLLKENSFLRELSHSNISSLLPVPSSLSAVRGVMSLVAYIEHDIQSLCRTYHRKEGASCLDVRNGLIGLSSAVAYMHAKGICHRNIQPSHIRLDVQFQHEPCWRDLVLCDFENACRCEASINMIGPCGAWRYCAPEMLQSTPYTDKVDVWSMASSLASCLIGTEKQISKDANFRHVMNILGNRDKLALLEGTVSSSNLQHSQFSAVGEALSRGLKPCPWERLSAKALLTHIHSVAQEPAHPQVVDLTLKAPEPVFNWRRATCVALASITHVPLRKTDVKRIAANLAQPHKQSLLAWFKSYCSACEDLEIEVSGAAAAAALYVDRFSAEGELRVSGEGGARFKRKRNS